MAFVVVSCSHNTSSGSVAQHRPSRLSRDPPDKRGREYKGWSLGGKLAKAVLYNGKFWEDLCGVVPMAAHGLAFTATNPSRCSEGEPLAMAL